MQISLIKDFCFPFRFGQIIKRNIFLKSNGCREIIELKNGIKKPHKERSN